MVRQLEDSREPVLFVTQHYTPEVIGSAPYCADLAEGLVRRGRQVTVLAGLPHYPDPTEFEAFYRRSASTAEVVGRGGRAAA
jgi:colanic acid biosynthesis glycosyl transferase WcaI